MYVFHRDHKECKYLTEQDKKSMEMDKEVLNSCTKEKSASISKDLLIRGDVLQLGHYYMISTCRN